MNARPAPDHPESAPRRIVVRGVNWLGDAVMTTPALLRLREAFPAAQIALLTPAKLADLWRDHPAVDTVLGLERGRGVWSLRRRLGYSPSDLGIVFPNSFRSAFEIWLSGARRRLGYAGNGRSWLLTDAVARPAGYVAMRKPSVAEIRRRLSAPAERRSPLSSAGSALHHLHHYLHLLPRLGIDATPVAPRVRVRAAEIEAARSRFGLAAGTAWLGINAGAEYGPAKRWPGERFAAVAREAAAWPGWGVALFGGPADAALAGAVAQSVQQAGAQWASKPRVVNLAGQTSLRELCAALAACRALLTNDTGPMHLAAALGVAVVAVFGSTAPELTGPGLPGDPRHQVARAACPCAPCFLRRCPIDLRCFTAIEPAAVIEALLRIPAQD